jgi:hypothetical protein
VPNNRRRIPRGPGAVLRLRPGISGRESIELPGHYIIDRILWLRSIPAVEVIAEHNSIGGDRFRLGSIVPGEAGRESKVNSLMFLGNQ